MRSFFQNDTLSTSVLDTVPVPDPAIHQIRPDPDTIPLRPNRTLPIVAKAKQVLHVPVPMALPEPVAVPVHKKSRSRGWP